MQSAYLIDMHTRGELPLGLEPKSEAYICILCGKKIREEFQPVCTGPHPSLDEHEPLMMELLPNG